jgi:hypothetical protein
VTATQLGNFSSSLAALESKVDAATNQSSSVQGTLLQGSQQLQSKTEGLQAAVTALNSTVLQLTLMLKDSNAQIAALNSTVQQLTAMLKDSVAQVTALVAASQTVNRDIAALKAETAAIASINATVRDLTSRSAADAAAITLVNASLTTLEATVSAINLTSFLKNTDAIDAALLGGLAAAQYLRKRIVLYSSPPTLNGGHGGRAGADSKCQRLITQPTVGLIQARAFLSVNAADEIRDFPQLYGVPTNLPIESAGGTVIAGNWTELLSGSIRASLRSAGVVSSSAWWSGSNADGSLAAPTCNAWSSAAFTDAGTTGSSDATGTAWMKGNAPFVCSNTVDVSLLCIAF